MSPAYDPMRARVGDPVPLARQAETLAWAAANWWETWRYRAHTAEADAVAHWDFDVALAAARRTLQLLTDLAGHIGDERVLSSLERALAAETAKAAAAEVAA